MGHVLVTFLFLWQNPKIKPTYKSRYLTQLTTSESWSPWWPNAGTAAGAAESSHLKKNANWEQYLEISQLTASDIPPNFSQTVFLTGTTY